MRRYKAALVALALVLVSSGTATAGDRDHMSGFFLRLSGGVGAAESKIESSAIDSKVKGATGDFNFAIGGIIAKNLAFHGTLWGWSMTDPEVTLGTLPPAQTGADFTLSALGAGITYYFMPANIYFSPSLGIGFLSVDGAGGSGESDAGVVFDLTFGKEWWVGNRWGLGIALAGGYHSVPDGGVDANWKGPSFGVRFSATYN